MADEVSSNNSSSSRHTVVVDDDNGSERDDGDAAAGDDSGSEREDITIHNDHSYDNIHDTTVPYDGVNISAAAAAAGKSEQGVISNKINHWSVNLTCPVCLGVYTKPRLLECGHSFCKRCIEGLISVVQNRGMSYKRQIIKCPLCREQTKVRVYDRYAVKNKLLEGLCKKWEREGQPQSMKEVTWAVEPKCKGVQTEPTLMTSRLTGRGNKRRRLG